ncbi:MAG: hypothetical protein K2M65_01160, partial [Muribaculaceae bacterium]|nr:hypothetical protein [Muribaculaceae bacterium]
IFKRGINAAKLSSLKLRHPTTQIIDQGPDTIAAADSVRLIQEGLIEAPAELKPATESPKNKKKRK